MRTPLLLACLLLAACDLAPTPKADPDTSAAAREAARHPELKNAIDSVDEREKARHANDAVIEADKKREQELQDAGG
jgi:hypothetical protein